MKKPKRPAVYSIAHPSSTKVYVGSSIDVDKRWCSHRKDLELLRHRCQHLQRAWNKHGGENFVFTILEECQPVKEQLLSREQHWMDHYEPTGLYNSCPVAGSPLGLKLTIQQRENISKALKGKKKSASHKERMSISAKERVRSPEELEQFAAHWVGKQKSPEHLQKIGTAVAARWAGRSPEEKALRNPAARKCEVLGKKYGCLKFASADTGMSVYYVKKHPTFKWDFT
jgi:group I intron endonuclease